MVAQIFSILFKVLVMILILAGMVLVLFGLRHYLVKDNRQEFDDSDNDSFRREIRQDETVISRHNLFRRFFCEDEEEPSVPRFFGGEGKKKDADGHKDRDIFNNRFR